MRIDSTVPGNYIEVSRDRKPGYVCIQAHNGLSSHTCNSLNNKKARAFALNILELAGDLPVAEEVQPIGAG